WAKDEDDVVTRLVGQYGPKRWSLIASNLPGRTGKQCRERWHNQLDPNIKKEGWSEEEDMTLLRAHLELGNHWLTTVQLAGRTDNAIKNRWNSTMRK
ncbi:C-Myb R2r3, partial [Baffinella frigidus]